jgi:DNA polymerase IV (DinB-like DNA polymerase)
MRIIMLIDMDYFFAQVEERENPELKGKPVVVGANPKEGKGRGVVCTSNYLARKFGIKSAMPISTAWHKCPTAVFLPVRGELYYEASRNVMRIFRQFADKFEQVSVDEAYFDVSNRCKSFEEARELAIQIKKEVLEKEHLTCSVGIGPNKLIAKIAAGENKPDGLTIVLPDDVASFLNPKKVGALYGIGPKTEANLNSLGIITVDDLVNMPKEMLLREMGSFGEDIWHMARGLDNREVNEDWITKSIGRQYTFERDTKNKRFIMAMIDDMIREIYRELKEQNFFFKNITLKVRYEDFDTHTKSKTIEEYTDSVKTLRMIAEEQLNPFLKDNRRIRLVGISVHTLSDKKIKPKRKDMSLLSI